MPSGAPNPAPRTSSSSSSETPTRPRSPMDAPPDDADNGSDADSAFGGDSFIGDETKTLSEYITEYRFEYGRRYHAYRDGAYWVWLLYLLNSCSGSH